jgi:hypothetical protein
VTVVFAEELRENGGAINVSDLLRTFVEFEIPIALPTGVLGTFSFLDTGKSFLADRAEDVRGPVYHEHRSDNHKETSDLLHQSLFFPSTRPQRFHMCYLELEMELQNLLSPQLSEFVPEHVRFSVRRAMLPVGAKRLV